MPIDRERWRELPLLLDKVLELPTAARVPWLESLGNDEPALAAELTALPPMKPPPTRSVFSSIASPHRRRSRVSSLAHGRSTSHDQMSLRMAGLQGRQA